MQIENGKTGNEFIGASLARDEKNDLMIYVIFGNGETITFDEAFYIVRSSKGFDIHKDARIDETMGLIDRLMTRNGY